MLFLLIAIAICVLVPWLSVLMLRRLPRRPPPLITEGQLHHLAWELQRTKVRPPAKARLPEDDLPDTGFLPPRPADDIPDPRMEASEQDAAPSTPGKSLNAPQKAVPPSLALRWHGCMYTLFVLLYMAAIFPVTFCWAVLFDYLGEARARSFEPAVFLFKPDSYGLTCGAAGVFLSVHSAMALLILLAWLLLGRRRILGLLHWDEGRLGSGNWDHYLKVATGMAVFFSLVCTIYIYLVMNWYARLTEDEIAIERFAGFGEEVHSYNDVKHLVVFSHYRHNKEIMPGEGLEIRFRNGRKWSTDLTFVLPRDPAERDRLFEFLTRKTGKPITRVRLAEEAPR